MFKAARITVLSLILIVVGLNSWLSNARTTDWHESLWVTVYPINADGSDVADAYLKKLTPNSFVDIEKFIARESARYGQAIERPVSMHLGQVVAEQPPTIAPGASVPTIMWWSLKLRLWASRIVGSQDGPQPDIKIFLRLHQGDGDQLLDNSMGLRKGMIGIVNARAGRNHQRSNNIVIAHELLHTLGASDKYEPGSGQPLFPDGIADPSREPLYPQVQSEIMAGRIPIDDFTIKNPTSLNQVIIGPKTAREIRLID